MTGLVRVDYPAIPRPRWRCEACGCHVRSDHVPGSRDCVESKQERDASRRS